MPEVIPCESIGLQRVELCVGGRMDLTFFLSFFKGRRYFGDFCFYVAGLSFPECKTKKVAGDAIVTKCKETTLCDN